MDGSLWIRSFLMHEEGKMKKNGIILFVFSMSFVFSSCLLEKLQGEMLPKFTVEKLGYREKQEAGSQSECELPEGIYFDFCNKSDKKVLFIQIKLNVYDKRTGNAAFAGTGTITCNFDGTILSGETKEFCIPLNTYIPVSTEMDLFIDSFFISRVMYSDGSIWRDFFGTYAISGGRN